MTKIQDHVIQSGDQDETFNVDDKPAISKSIPSQARPSGEPLERPDTSYGRLTPEVLSYGKTCAKEIEIAGVPTLTETTSMRSIESKTSANYGKYFQEDLEAQLKRMKERQPKGLLVWKGFAE